MRVKNMISVAAIVAATALPHTVLAQTMAEATTDLNIRSGPGPEYPVIGAIQRDDEATIFGCLQDSLWCQVSYNGRQGWAYSKYLIRDVSGETVIVTERRAQVGIPTVRYETTGTAEATTTGAAGGAITGALIGGPIGAVVGGVAGAAIGGAVNPPEQVQTYVTRHPGEPVLLEGEVVVGATLPESVELRPVPDYEYRYVYVNRQPVLVEPRTRRIVHIYR
jgi:uncharacterized protein YraI